jgi:hypothetical protein
MKKRKVDETLSVGEEYDSSNTIKKIVFERSFDHVDGNWPSHMLIPLGSCYVWIVSFSFDFYVYLVYRKES